MGQRSVCGLAACCLLLSTLPARAGQPISLLTPEARLELTTLGAASSQHDTYLQQCRDDLRAWRQRLGGYNRQALAEGRKADEIANDDINQLWNRLRLAAERLQAASSETWPAAQSAYEQAARELDDAWSTLDVASD